MSRKNLSAQVRLNMIFNEQIQFDIRKKVTGVLTGALPTPTAPAPPLPAPPVLPMVVGKNGIRSDIASENEDENLKEHEKFK